MVSANWRENCISDLDDEIASLSIRFKVVMVIVKSLFRFIAQKKSEKIPSREQSERGFFISQHFSLLECGRKNGKRIITIG